MDISSGCAYFGNSVHQSYPTSEKLLHHALLYLLVLRFLGFEGRDFVVH